MAFAWDIFPSRTCLEEPLGGHGWILTTRRKKVPLILLSRSRPAKQPPQQVSNQEGDTKTEIRVHVNLSKSQ